MCEWIEPLLKRMNAVCDESVEEKNMSHTRFLRGYMYSSPSGQLRMEISKKQASGVLSSFLESNCEGGLDMLYKSNPLSNEEKTMLTGVILAGGKSRRMGGAHKALLPFHNEMLIHRQIRHLKQLCAEIILVTNEPQAFTSLIDNSIRIITDIYPDTGPLGGMHATFSLSQAKYHDIWLVGCDMRLFPLKQQN